MIWGYMIHMTVSKEKIVIHVLKDDRKVMRAEFITGADFMGCSVSSQEAHVPKVLCIQDAFLLITVANGGYLS